MSWNQTYPFPSRLVILSLPLILLALTRASGQCKRRQTTALDNRTREGENVNVVSQD